MNEFKALENLKFRFCHPWKWKTRVKENIVEWILTLQKLILWRYHWERFELSWENNITFHRWDKNNIELKIHE